MGIIDIVTKLSLLRMSVRTSNGENILRGRITFCFFQDDFFGFDNNGNLV